jgi:hypothetical protein
MPTHLFDGTTWVVHDDSNPADPYEIGNRFGCTAELSVTGLRWYRWTVGSSNKPAALRLWRASDSALIATISPAPDDGAVGWQDSELPAPIPLTVGTTYVVSMDWPAGQNWATKARGTISVAPTPALWDDNARAFHAGAFTYPGTVDNANAWGVDITWDGPTGGPIGGGGGTSTADLAAWLSGDDEINTHQSDGLPWLTKALLDAWNSGLGAGAVGYFQFMKTAINAVKERTDRLPDSIEALTNAILTNLSDNTDLVLAGLATIQAGVDALTGGSGGTAGGALGALSGRSAFPTTGWTMADETDWDTDLAWPVAADLYVFTVTTPPPGAAADSFAGVTWYHRMGSWTTLDGDQAGARAFLEFSPQQLQDGGRRMPGLAFRTKNGTLGHVQAWLLA